MQNVTQPVSGGGRTANHVTFYNFSTRSCQIHHFKTSEIQDPNYQSVHDVTYPPGREAVELGVSFSHFHSLRRTQRDYDIILPSHLPKRR